MSPGNKNAPTCPSSDCRPVRRLVQLDARAPCNLFFSMSFSFFLSYLYTRREGANHISMTSLVQKRTCGRLQSRATRKVLCRSASELAGFTRAMWQSTCCPVVLRSCLPQVRLLSHLLILPSFYFFFFFFSSCKILVFCLFWYCAVFLHMEASLHCSKNRSSACRIYLSRIIALIRQEIWYVVDILRFVINQDFLTLKFETI